MNAIQRQSDLIVTSFFHWFGKPLIAADQLYDAPFVVLSHGLEDDPILNYGNALALKLWEMPWDVFTRTPSRLTAEAPDRETRAKLLNDVRTQGFTTSYSGVRISATGKRFRIENVIVFNLLDHQQKPAGQAATFDRWIPID